MPGLPDKDQPEVTREQGPIRALASITYRETLSPPPAGGAQSTNSGPVSGY